MQSMKELQEKIIQFRDKRNWWQFHTPRNLAESISIEAAELLELYQWGRTPGHEDLRDEIADIGIYLLTLCNEVGIDLKIAIEIKLEKNGMKYPVDEFYGSNEKSET